MEAKPYKIPHPFRKCSKERIDKIVDDIRRGSTQKQAALVNGITESCFYIWLEQGKVDIDHEVESLPAYLVESLETVKQAEVIWCRDVIKFSEKGHKGAEWTLEHAYWRDFGKTSALIELADEIAIMKLSQGAKNEQVNSGGKKEDTEC